MKRGSRERFGVQGSRVKKSYSRRVFLLIVLLLAVFSFAAGCRKKEKALPALPAIESKAMEQDQVRSGEQKALQSPAQTQGIDFHSTLIKDLNRRVPATSFSNNDRIYLLTVWTGLQGPHEIKVLWIRPDGKIQETVRLKENVSSKTPTFTSWAYLSFTKGLLNISPMEGKFTGAWKAQLFLDGTLLREYDFTVL
jgi:hypothetical protein